MFHIVRMRSMLVSNQKIEYQDIELRTQGNSITFNMHLISYKAGLKNLQITA